MDAREEVRLAQEALERAQAKLAKADRIKVPDGIRFDHCDSECSSGLLFNDGSQALAYNHARNTWIVVSKDRINSVMSPLYLEPCSRSELKAGDWAFAWGSSTQPDFSDKDNYHLILNKGSHVYIDGDSDIVAEADSWNYWHKVVR